MILAIGAVVGGTALANRLDVSWGDGGPVQAGPAERRRLAEATQSAELLRQTRAKLIARVADTRRDLLVEQTKLNLADGDESAPIRKGLAERTELIAALEHELSGAVTAELTAATELAAAAEAEQKSRGKADRADRAAKAADRGLWMLVVWTLLSVAYLVGRWLPADRPTVLHPGRVTGMSVIGVLAVAAVPLVGWPAVVGAAVTVVLLLILRAR